MPHIQPGCTLMPVIQRLVSPRLPIALANRTHVDLPGHDLWFHNIDNVHVLPTELDVPRFEEALSKVLQLYPHAAGQLRHNGGRWSIELTNTAVPVDIDYKLHTTSDSLLNSDWVIQDDISIFLNHQPVDHINGAAPLLHLKLTFFNNETCIGVSWHHTLGDAILLSCFMHTLSQFYQRLPCKYAAPNFNRYHFPAPSCSMSAEFWPSMPQLHHTCLSSELGGICVDLCKNVEHLRWRFDNRDLTKLCSALSSQNEVYLSKQDCLTAYLVAILNHHSNTPVNKVMNVSSYRNISAPFISENVAGNAFQSVSATVPTDMVGIATALRHALIRSREPDYIHSWMAVASNHMLETANAEKIYVLCLIDDTVVTVNSNTVIDWCGAHFGFPNGSRFYTSMMAKHYLRCFMSNPVKGDNGEWQVRQSVDISMGVAAGLKPKFLETLSSGIQHIPNKECGQS